LIFSSLTIQFHFVEYQLLTHIGQANLLPRDTSDGVADGAKNRLFTNAKFAPLAAIFQGACDRTNFLENGHVGTAAQHSSWLVFAQDECRDEERSRRPNLDRRNSTYLEPCVSPLLAQAVDTAATIEDEAQNAAARYGMENILEADGFGLAITGLFIVFIALVGITLFIAVLPKVLALIEPYLPAEAHHHGHAPDKGSAQIAPVAAVDVSEEEAVVAAIGFAMHARRASS